MCCHLVGFRADPRAQRERERRLAHRRLEIQDFHERVLYMQHSLIMYWFACKVLRQAGGSRGAQAEANPVHTAIAPSAYHVRTDSHTTQYITRTHKGVHNKETVHRFLII